MYELTTSDDAARAGANGPRPEFIDYVAALIAAKRRAAGRAARVAAGRVEDEGERLTEDEIICTVIVLLNAGHEATVNTLGNGMRAFLTHPDQWRRVVDGEVPAADGRRGDDPLGRAAAAVRALGARRRRRDRRAAAGGRRARSAMLFGAANRDPRRFADPDRFDAGRGDATHVGFGGGIHFCVGAPSPAWSSRSASTSCGARCRT